MGSRIVVVGAGVIGAAVAYNLRLGGADVTVVSDTTGQATRASFGWVNASFHLNEDHFRLRHEAMAAFRRLERHMVLPGRVTGCLSWEFAGSALNDQAQRLSALGYSVDVLDARGFRRLEPNVANPPAASLRFPDEFAVDPGALTRRLLDAATAAGARILSGLTVEDFQMRGTTITGVVTRAGVIEADQVVVAAGTGTPALLEPLGIAIPMLKRPGLMMVTNPVGPLISHVLVSEMGELKQDDAGCLIMPAAIGHQADSAERIDTPPPRAADETLARLQTMFPDIPLTWSHAMVADRPVPADGLPVVGAVADGLYIATMHSGITLAALVGELAAAELLGNASAQTETWLSSYRPQRFQSPL